MIRQPLIVAAAAAILLGMVRPAAAQDAPPEVEHIGRFVADVRGTFPKFKQDPLIATGIGVTAANLPIRAYGFVVGAHFYPARLGVVTFGVGGELVMARRSRTLAAASATAEPGPTVNSRFKALTPQVSFNFGGRQGWSYISGGIGTSKFTAERADTPLPAQESGSKTINYGGGARWFSKEHIAFSVDLRFYAINPQFATTTRPAAPRMTLWAFSVGAAFK
ncbi:MAG: hypothetical protein ABJC89_01235 [Acidobacteriota bacterium]